MTDTSEMRETRIKRILGDFMVLMWISGRQFNQMLQSFGLTPPQFWALAMLVYGDTCPMNDLAKMTFHDGPTLTGVIDRLVKVGLVERSSSQEDRRLVLVQATPAGLDVFHQIRNKIVGDSKDRFAMFNTEQLDQIESIFSHFLGDQLQQLKSPEELEHLEQHFRKIEFFVDVPIERDLASDSTVEPTAGPDSE